MFWRERSEVASECFQDKLVSAEPYYYGLLLAMYFRNGKEAREQLEYADTTASCPCIRHMIIVGYGMGYGLMKVHNLNVNLNGHSGRLDDEVMRRQRAVSPYLRYLGPNYASLGSTVDMFCLSPHEITGHHRSCCIDKPQYLGNLSSKHDLVRLGCYSFDIAQDPLTRLPISKSGSFAHEHGGLLCRIDPTHLRSLQCRSATYSAMSLHSGASAVKSNPPERSDTEVLGPYPRRRRAYLNRVKHIDCRLRARLVAK